MVKVNEIVSVIEHFAPLHLAEKWDNVGLLIGDKQADVTKVLISLDITDDVIDEAIDNNVDLIISHHPNLFKSVKTLVVDNPFQKNYMRLIAHQINVYAAHTNIDNAFGGMNDWLSEAIGLKNVEVLDKQGTYLVDNVEVAYGSGKIGELEHSCQLEALLQIIKENLKTPHIKVAKAKQLNRIKKVALCGGAGSDFYQSALKKGADVYLTGDVSYHVAQDMQKRGLTLVDIGHYAEVIFIEKISKIYENWVNKNKMDLVVLQSKVNTNPFS